MSREVRRVPADWVHPKYMTDWGEERYDPLLDNFIERYDGFCERVKENGLQEAMEWYGGEPNPQHHMPDWSEEEKTHYMMYETVSEGTPISPAFETPEELAQWLADNDGDACAGRTASYDAWLRVANGGYAPSMVISNGQFMSGVEFLDPTENAN